MLAFVLSFISLVAAAEVHSSSGCSGGVCSSDVEELAPTGGLVMLQAKTKLHNNIAAADQSRESASGVTCTCGHPGMPAPKNDFKCSNGDKGYGSPHQVCSKTGRWPKWTNSTELHEIFKAVPYKICGNQALREGSMLMSHNRKVKLVVQSDGNAVLYRTRDGQALWGANQYPGKGAKLVMQDDCNLVVYDKDDKPHWDLKTDQDFLDKVKEIGEKIVTTAKQTVENVKNIKNVEDVVNTGKHIQNAVEGPAIPCPTGKRDAHACLEVQDDCNIVVYTHQGGRQPLWSSRTSC